MNRPTVQIYIRRGNGHEPLQVRTWRALCAAPGAAATTRSIGLIVRREGEGWRTLRSNIPRYLRQLAAEGLVAPPRRPGGEWRALRRIAPEVPFPAPGGGIVLVIPPRAVEPGALWRGLLQMALERHGGPRGLARKFARALPGAAPSEATLRDWASGRRTPRPHKIRLLMERLTADGEIAPAPRNAPHPPPPYPNRNARKSARDSAALTPPSPKTPEHT